jgi:hypothetical protein
MHLAHPRSAVPLASTTFRFVVALALAAGASACSAVPAEDAAGGTSGGASAGGGLPPSLGTDASAGGASTTDAGPGGGGTGGPPASGGCLPAQEVCDAVDNDCDGEVDEVGCACTAETACYEGASATRGVGACRDGTRACDDRGEFFGPCAGSVLPADDICNGLDDDCDGTADEACCQFQDCPDAERVPDAGRPDAACVPGTPGCGGEPGLTEEVFVVGETRAPVPVDYVMVVDNSGSMNDTVRQVEGNLGELATRLANAGLDYHFVLLAEQGTDPDDPDICLPPPMAGPNCTDTERFRHLDQKIRSHDAFEHTVNCVDGCDSGAGGYRAFLRPDALLQVLVVSDDESDMPFEAFAAEMAGRGLPELTLHAVVGLRDDDCVADIGNEYMTGVQATGGERLHICDQNWGQVIQVLFDATVVRIQSVYVLAGVPDPATLRVFVTPPGGAELEAVGTWDYDARTNAVVFRPGSAPLVGSRVTVRFRAR